MVTNILLLTLIVYIIGNAGGYLVHWALHQEWSGRAYRDHYNHHFEIYPPDDYLSIEYREPPPEAEQAKYYVPVFLLLFSPVLLWHWAYYLVAIVEAVVVLKANAVVHDAIHVTGHRWEKYAWFTKLRAIHFEHHVDTGTNLGIFSFFTDRIMRTYQRVSAIYISTRRMDEWQGKR